MFLRSHARAGMQDTEAGVSTSTTTLLNITEDVFHACLLPRLGIHDLLSLRRVCRWTKYVSDVYLKTHPLRKKIVNIGLDAPDDSNLSIGTFLRSSTMLRPVCTFRFLFNNPGEAFRNPLLPEFLELYGKQILYIQVSSMSFPMEMEEEFAFYESLQKLRCLTVLQWQDCGTYVDENQYIFPTTFGKLIKLCLGTAKEKPNLLSPSIVQEQKLNHFWRLVEFCKDLQYLRLPQLEDHHLQFKLLQTTLEQGHHKKFHSLDLTNCTWPILQRQQRRISAEVFLDFVTSNKNVNLVNVQANFLGIIKAAPRPEIADRVVSIRKFTRPSYFNLVSLPRAYEIKDLIWYENSPAYVALTPPLTLHHLYPRLRKLSIEVEAIAPGHSLEILWREFRNLEEVSLRRGRGLPRPIRRQCSHCANHFHSFQLVSDDPDNDTNDDAIFFGSDRALPAFLQLTELKTLSLDVGPGPTKLRYLTDEVFLLIFSQMTLRELYLKSDEPITSFTRSGVQALLSGPFRQSVKKFPFRGWSLAGLSNAQFRRLGRKFPENLLF